MTHVTLKSSARAAAIAAMLLLAAPRAWSADADWRDAEAAYDQQNFAGARDQSAPDDEPYVPGPHGC